MHRRRFGNEFLLDCLLFVFDLRVLSHIQRFCSCASDLEHACSWILLQCGRVWVAHMLTAHTGSKHSMSIGKLHQEAMSSELILQTNDACVTWLVSSGTHAFMLLYDTVALQYNNNRFRSVAYSSHFRLYMKWRDKVHREKANGGTRQASCQHLRAHT